MINSVDEIELCYVSEFISKSIENRLRKMNIDTIGKLKSLKREDYINFQCPHPLSLNQFDRLRSTIYQTPEKIISIYLNKMNINEDDQGAIIERCIESEISNPEIDNIPIRHLKELMNVSVFNRLIKMRMGTIEDARKLDEDTYSNFPCEHPVGIRYFREFKQLMFDQPELIKKTYENYKDVDIPFSIDVPIGPKVSFMEVFRSVIDDYLSLLPRDLDKDVICKRYGIGEDRAYLLEEIGLFHSLTRERIRQIVQRNMNEIRLLLSGSVVRRIGRSCRPEVLLRFEEVIGQLKDRIVINGERELQDLDLGRDDYAYFRIFLESYDALYLRYENHDLFVFGMPINQKKLQTICQNIMMVLKEAILPVSEFELIVSIRKSIRNISFDNQFIEALCLALPDIEIVDIDDEKKIQVRINRLVSIKDQGYRILHENNNSMHFKDIHRELVHRLAINGEGKDIPVETLRSMLGLSEKLVPIGKTGKWALKEWGENTSSIHDLIANVLKSRNSPMSFDDINVEVSKIRSGVSADSIRTLLSMKEDLFCRIHDGQYILKTWEKNYSDELYNTKRNRAPLDQISTAIIKLFEKNPSSEIGSNVLTKYFKLCGWLIF